jgi:hypothetical protein
MAETRYDETVELKFLDAKIVQLQKDLLDMENNSLPETEQLVQNLKDAIDRKKKALDDFRVRRIRLAAEIDEAKGVEVIKSGAKVPVDK